MGPLIVAERGLLDLTVYDATGATVQGTGPLTVLTAEIGEKLNEVRTFSCCVPAAEANSVELVVARQVKLRREGDGVIFTGYIETLEYTDQGNAPIVTVTGVGLEIELVEANVYYGVNLTGMTSAKVTQLLALVTDTTWTATVEGGIYAVADYRVDGMSIWAALVDLAQKAGGYLRLTTTTRQVEVKATNTASSLRLTNMEGGVPTALGANIGLIAALRGYREDASGIVNRIVPFGAGQGDLPLTLAKSTRSSPYTIQSLTPFAIRAFIGSDHGTWLLTHAASATTQERTQGVGRRVGQNRILIIVYSVNAHTGSFPTGVRFGGESLTHYASYGGSGANVGIDVWYLINPALGEPGGMSYITDLPGAGGSVARPQLFVLDGVDPDSPIVAAYSNQGNSPTAIVTATDSAPTETLLHVVALPDANKDVQAAAAWTLLYQIIDVFLVSGRGEEKRGSSGSIAATNSLPATLDWRALILRLRAARNWYIEDTTSQSSYRKRTAIYQAKDAHIVPVDVIASANALYDAAATYLARAKDPLIHYGETEPVGLGAAAWKIGDTIRLMYRGLTTDRFGNAVKWLDVDANAVLLEQRQTFGTDGVRRWSFELASAIKTPPTLTGLMSKVDELARLPAL